MSDTSKPAAALRAVRKSITVRATTERAFQLFTTEQFATRADGSDALSGARRKSAVTSGEVSS